ncbi:MAG: hypothetical protein AB1726_11195 [Planctomycetota bacterium]
MSFPSASPRPRRVLLVAPAPAAEAPLAAALRDRGCDVVLAGPEEAASVVTAVDVVVVLDHDTLDAGTLAALGLREAGIPAIVVGENADFDRCRRAMRAGAVDYLRSPLAPASLLEAIETADPAGGATRFLRHYFHGRTSHDRALRELSAHLLESGIGPVHRARITSSVAHALHHLHARRGDAPLRLEMVRNATAVRVEVGAAGSSDPAAIPPPLPAPRLDQEGTEETKHLARARVMAEELRLVSDRAHEEVELVFELLPVTFEADELDLSNADYLDPRVVDRLLAALRDEAADRPHLVPTAMATTVGRLLALPNAHRPADAPLRS